MQFTACAVLAGEEDHLAFAGLQRHIRQRPFIEVVRAVREKIAKQRNRFGREVFQLNPFFAVAVRIDCGERVVLEYLVDVDRIGLIHNRHLQRGECLVAVCGLKRRVSGIDRRTGGILDDRYTAGHACLPADPVDEVPLQVRKEYRCVLAAEPERRMDAVFPVAAESGQIDADITARGYGSGRNLPLERVGFIVRKAVVFELHRVVAVVAQFHPAIAACIVRGHHFANG